MSLQNPLRPQTALKDIESGEHFYPMTCASQVLMEDGSRLNAYLENFDGGNGNITAEKVTMASGLSLEQTLAGCRIDFTDADGNPTDEPYIHWFVDSETGAAVSQGLPNAEEGEF